MRRWALIAALAASFAGVVLAGMSTGRHFRILQHGVAEASYCSLSETIDCDAVNTSSHSELFGVPVSWWGVLFYLLAGVFTANALRLGTAGAADAAAAWLLSLGGLAFSFYLAWVSAFVIKAYCLECLGLYGTAAALAVALFWGLDPKRNGVPAPRFRHAAAGLGVFLAGWILIAGVSASWFPKKPGRSAAELLAAFEAREPVEISPDPHWASWGSPEPVVEIVEFSDFECPFCRDAAFKVKPYLREFAGSVRLRFANYPLDPACNPALTQPMHATACFAAKAGICAQKFGGFWAYHDEAFRSQDKMSRIFLLGLAEKSGWDRAAFLACVESPETGRRLAADIAAARALEVGGTPTIFMDGRRLTGWDNPDFLREAVRTQIRKQAGRS